MLVERVHAFVAQLPDASHAVAHGAHRAAVRHHRDAPARHHAQQAHREARVRATRPRRHPCSVQHRGQAALPTGCRLPELRACDHQRVAQHRRQCLGRDRASRQAARVVGVARSVSKMLIGRPVHSAFYCTAHHGNAQSPIEATQPARGPYTPRPITAVAAARRVWASSGLRGFYRGLGIAVMGRAVEGAVYWTAYEHLRDASGDPDHPGSLAARTVASKTLSTVLCYPLMVARTQLWEAASCGQRRLPAVLYAAWVAAGPRGAYAGLSMSLLRVVPSWGVTMVTYGCAMRAMGHSV
eukprot:TRINITY_DN5299_c0_g1_i2.p2 TRINITY_DN5299_c0_g1~~TRINITY_DN5299_c0_g1_i2.p2  ORF type:complete len:297 (-),score=16.68 TRINITY_DN5299_c0_g1_i2:167-1057(-)